MPRKSWWARLPFGLRMTAGAGALLVAIGGGAAGIAALPADKPQVATAAARESAAAGVGTSPEDDPTTQAAGPGTRAPVAAMGRREVSDEADRTATRSPRRTAGAQEPGQAPAQAAGQQPGQAPGQASGQASGQQPGQTPAQPQVTRQTVTETRAIPFPTRLVRDPSMPRGTKRVQTEGVAGEETLRYLVTYSGGQETGRQLLGSTVTKAPQQRVIAFGSQGTPGGPRPGGGGLGGGPDGGGRLGGGHGGPGRHHGCGPGLRGCLPLARSACPPEAGVEESGSVDVMDQDLSMLDPEALDGLELNPVPACA